MACNNILSNSGPQQGKVFQEIKDLIIESLELNDSDSSAFLLGLLKSYVDPKNNTFDSIETLALLIEEAGQEINEEEPDTYNTSRFPLTIGGSKENNTARVNELMNLMKGIEPTKAPINNGTSRIEPVEKAQRFDKRFLLEAFGTASKALEIAEKHGTFGLVSSMLINRGYLRSPHAVKGTVKANQLNSQIRAYQEQLYEDIYGYVLSKLNTMDKAVKALYDIDGFKEHDRLFDVSSSGATILKVGSDAIQSMDYIETHFGKLFSRTSNFTDQELVALSDRRSTTDLQGMTIKEKAEKGIELAAEDILQAYESYVLLKNFDSLIKLELGDSVEITNENEFNRLSVNDNKYKIATKGDQMNRTWRQTDEMFLEMEVSRLVLKLIETTPMWSKNTSGIWMPSTTNTLKFQDFSAVVANIKHLAYDPSTSIITIDALREWDLSNETKEYFDKLSNKYGSSRTLTLRDVIDSINIDPDLAFAAVMDIMASDTLWSTKVAENPLINEGILHNIIYSVHKGLSSYDLEQALHGSSLRNYNALVDLNYYSYVTLMVLSTFKNQYLQCYTDQNGNVQLRTLADYGVANVARRLRDTILNKNSHKIGEGAVDSLISKYDIKLGQLVENGSRFSETPVLIGQNANGFNAIQINIPWKFTTANGSRDATLQVTLSINGSKPMYSYYYSDNPANVYIFDDRSFARMSEREFTSLLGNDEGTKGLIEDVLGINLYNNDSFLDAYKEAHLRVGVVGYNWGGMALELLNLSSHILLNRLVSTKLIMNPLKANSLSGEIAIKDVENMAQLVYGLLAPSVNIDLGEINLINANAADGLENQLGAEAELTLRNLAIAKAKAEGMGRASQTKDSENNSLSNYTLSRLLGSISSQMSIQCKTLDSATSGLSLVDNANLLKGFYKLQEALINGVSKKTTLFNVAELSSASFVLNFLDGLVAKNNNSVIGFDEATGNRNCGFLASVNSDKPTIDFLVANLGALINHSKYSNVTKEVLAKEVFDKLPAADKARLGGDFEKLSPIVKEDLIKNLTFYDLEASGIKAVIAEEIGLAYNTVLNHIQEDYNRLGAYILTQSEEGLAYINYLTNKGLEEVNSGEPLSFFGEYAQWLINNGEFETNGLTTQLAPSIESLYRFYAESVLDASEYLDPESIIDNIINRENLFNYSDGFAKFKDFIGSKKAQKFMEAMCLEYNSLNRINTVELVDQLHMNKGLTPNETLLNLVNRFSSPTSGESFWQTKNAEIVKSLLENGFEHTLTGKKASDTLLKDFLDGAWVKADTNKMIIAKFQYTKANGELSKVYELTSKVDVLRLESDLQRTGYINNEGVEVHPRPGFNIFEKASIFNKAGNLTLNPFLEKWNLFDYLFTQLHMMTSVGSHIAHPSKGYKENPFYTDEENQLAQEAARFFAQHKRNVSLTASMHEFHNNLVIGIPSMYNIATVRDVKDILYNLVGKTADVKPYDGATFVHPVLVRLENYSLGAEKAGNSKKQFVHFYNQRNANGGIVKTCGFGITNQLAMNTRMANVLRKMMNRKWISEDGTEVDEFGNFRKRVVDLGGIESFDYVTIGDNILQARFDVDLLGNSLCVSDNQQFADINYFDPETLKFYRRTFLVDDGVQIDLSLSTIDKANHNNDIYRDSEGNVIAQEDLPSMISFGDGTYRFNDVLLNTFTDENGKLVSDGSIAFNNGEHILKQSTVGSTNLNGELVALNNNWDVYQQVFKGQYCYDLIREKGDGDKEDNLLHYSETSLDNLTVMVNNMGYRKNQSKIETLDDVWQAGKHSDIHYLVTEGAIKLGAANINSAEVDAQGRAGVYDNDIAFNYQRIHTNLIGIQLDKEHHADGEELSLMRLVINGCTFRGFSPEVSREMFETLSTLTHIGLKSQLDEFAKFILTTQSSGEFEKTIELIVKKAILNSGPKDGNLINNIALDIQKLLELDPRLQLVDVNVDLPFSDAGLFPKLNSIIAAFVNRSGIRTKLDGILSVLNPSVGIKKIYNGHTIDYYRPEDFVVLSEELFTLMGNALPQEAVPYLNTLAGTSVPRQLLLEFCALENGQWATAPELISSIGTEYTLNNLARNFNLGSDYFITTRNEDGSFTTVSEKINLPEKYANLKERIYKGEVVGLRENILVGRDLAHYNATFKSIDGEKTFNIYDLDSSKALFAIKPVKDALKTCLNSDGSYNIPKLQAFFSGDVDIINGMFGSKAKDVLDANVENAIDLLIHGELKLNFNNALSGELALGVTDLGILLNYVLKIINSETSLRRLVQRDLNALTKEVKGSNYNSDYINQLQNILALYLQSWNILDKEAYRISQLELFDRAKSDKYFDIIHDGLEGNAIINKAIDEIALLRQQFTSLTGKTYNDFSGLDIEIRNEIKQHTLGSGDLVYIDGEYVQIDRKSINIKPYEVVMPKVFKTAFGLHTNDDVTEITNDPDFFFKRFLKNWKTKTNVEAFDYEFKRMSGDHLYVLDRKNLSKFRNRLRKIDILKDPERDDNSFTRQNSVGESKYKMYSHTNESGEVIDDEVWLDGETEIIVTDNPEFYRDHHSYNTIKFNAKSVDINDLQKFADSALTSNRKSVKNWYNFMSLGGTVTDVNVWNMMNDAIDNEIDNYEGGTIASPALQHLKDLGREIHTSFLKSLEIVAARIPAQSQQSFMPMKIVTFDNVDINSAYVSDAQIWLQGSDYDVDAVSLASYSFDRNGRFAAWSDYANLKNIDLLNASCKLPFPTGKSLFTETMQGNKPKLTLDAEVLNLSEESIREELASYGTNISQSEEQISTRRNETKAKLKDQEEMFKSIIRGEHASLIYHNQGELRPNGKPYKNAWIEVKTDTVELIEDLADVLRFYRNNGFVDIEHYYDAVGNYVYNDNLINLDQRLKSDGSSVELVLNSLARIIDRHNLTINNASENEQSLMAKNSVVHGMHQTTLRPVNLIESLTSVDDTTGPFKKKADTASSSKDLLTFTPGNVVNKIQAININQVGKEGISICAVGMKGFSAWTEYTNYLLNHGTSLLQKNLIIAPKGLWRFGHLNGVSTLDRLVANAHATDLVTVKNERVRKILQGINQDEDAVIALSALLSLATDNAKELCLGNLNAGTKLIGMYIYGLSVGIPFDEVSRILMSPLGLTVRDLMEGNVFTGQGGFTSLSQVLDYLMIGPTKLLKTSNKKVVSQIVGALKASLFNIPTYCTEDADVVGRFAHDQLSSLDSKIQFLEGLKSHNSEEEIDFEKNQLIDLLENYLYLVNTIKYETVKQYDPMTRTNVERVEPNDLYKLQILAEGADEMKSLGLVLGVANGIKTKLGESMAFMRNVQLTILNRQLAIYGKMRRDFYFLDRYETKPDGTRVLKKKPKQFNTKQLNFSRFMADEAYRTLMIESYEKVKHSINLLDIIDKVPHYNSYLEAAAMEFTGKKAISAKYRAVETLGDRAIQILGATKAADIEKIYNRVSDFTTDYIRREWLMSEKTVVKPGEKYMLDRPNLNSSDGMYVNDTNLDITIPKHNVPIAPGLYYFDEYNNLVLNEYNQTIMIPMGTLQGDATLKFWMENYIIPNLQQGLNFEGKLDYVLKGNAFLRELQPVITDRTPLHITTSAYSLGINMSPRDDVERGILNNYRHSFNSINSGQYMGKSVLEWLWLYNQVAFLGKPGLNTLTSIFDDLTTVDPLVKSFYKFETYFDKNRDIVYKINVTDADLVKWCTPTGNRNASHLSYLYSQDFTTMLTRLFELTRNYQDQASMAALEEAGIETTKIENFATYQLASLGTLPKWKEYFIRGLYELTQQIPLQGKEFDKDGNLINAGDPGYIPVSRTLANGMLLDLVVNKKNGRYGTFQASINRQALNPLKSLAERIMPTRFVLDLKNQEYNNIEEFREKALAVIDAATVQEENENATELALTLTETEQFKELVNQEIDRYKQLEETTKVSITPELALKIGFELDKVFYNKPINMTWKLDGNGLRLRQFDDLIILVYLDGIIDDIINCV